ncbi:MAG: Beta-barrel assembly-enhancing protease [Verrucomicrobiota bacterium]
MFPEAIPSAELNDIRALYERGLYGDAWRRMESFGTPEQWRDVPAMILAGRVIGNLEGERRARALHSRAYRLNRSHAEAAYYRAFSIRSRLGPLRALRFLETLPAFPDASPDVRSGFLSHRATLLAGYRDFASAERLYAEAEAIDGLTAWLLVERSSMLERADRYAEALETVQLALEKRPFYRPAVQSAAHLLTLLNRDEEAMSLLAAAEEHLQSPDVVAQLAVLLRERHRPAEALDKWRRYRELALMIEQPMVEYWHARMSDAHYDLGDITQAAAHAKQAKNGFHERIADRIAAPPAEARIWKLDVPFVRQHDMTCAPATLSAISRYWDLPLDHLALAREICYDGTQGHKERAWAAANGFVVREFTVTWDTGRALLDRGIPFTLATVETTSAHLQAVVGYDSVRGTIYLRDPFLKNHSECICPAWLEDYAFCGPRGMVLVPVAQASKLDGIDLPDAALWDLFHEVDRGLFLNDRPRAVSAIQSLEQTAPGHWLLFQSRRVLAWYDGDQPRALAATEDWLKLFPESNNLRWARYCALRDLARKSDHRALIEEMARGEKSEPLFWRELGEEMRADAREHTMARRWLLRVLRYQPSGAENLFSMAAQLWEERRFADSLPLYRLAAHLRDKVAYLQRAWFTAARYFHRTGEVLNVMAARAQTDGALSAEPAYIYHNALLTLDRLPEAQAVLENAIALRPEDGELLAFTADFHARFGRHAQAAELLAKAEGKCPRSSWLRTSARLADYRSDLPESLRLWREVLADSPLAFDAIRTIARLVAETENREAAHAFLAGRVELFPNHLPLRELQVDWLRDDGPEAQETELLALLEMAPKSSWALRERAFALSKLNRFDEALAAATLAVETEPQQASNHYSRGRVLFLAGRMEESAAAYRDAIRRAVDNSGALEGLLAASPTLEKKREALAFIRSELETQVVFGDGLFSYLEVAFPVLEPAELLQNLREAHTARPDLWHTWSVLVSILCDAGKAAEALPLAEEAVGRFPLNPRLWMDLAHVRCQQRNFPAEVEALRTASELAPAWGRASRALAEALQRCEAYDEAERVYEQAVAASPLDAVNRGCLAEFIWRRRRDPHALSLLEEAIRLEPGYSWAWDSLREWNGSPDRAVALSRELVKLRGGEASSWMRLATMLPEDSTDERLSLIDRAIALNPCYNDAHDARVRILCAAGRYDDASAACHPEAYGGNLPRGLRARSPWVKAQRGNLVGAVAEMKEVVAEHPDFYWAWERLAEWHSALGEHQAERDASERMARLDPRNAVPLGYLAEAEMKLGRRDAAFAVLERAFAIDPGYGYAAFTLFDSHLEKREFDKARAKLAQMRVHLPGADTIAAEVRLLAATGEKAKALDLFRELVAQPEREAQAVEAAGGAIRRAGWARPLERLIEPLLNDPGTNPRVAVEWVYCITGRDAWRKRRILRKLDPARTLTKHAWRAFFTVAGEKRKYRYIKEFIKVHRAALRADDDIWGTVGYGISVCDRDREALEWMADWRDRSGVRPWMLTNFASSARVCGKFAEAMSAHVYALTLKHDHTYPQHILWIAMSEIDGGQFAEARARLDEMRFDMLDGFCKTLWTAANAACAVHEASPDKKRSAYAAGVLRMNAAEHVLLKKDRYLRLLSRRMVTRMAREAGLSLPGFRGWWFGLRVQ